MSNCAIPGCRNQAVAWGLCAKHYMRKRRRGDPNAAFKRGRPLKPRPEAPEMVALRQENAALREEISLAEAQARSAAKPGVGPDETAAGRLAREVASLKEALARAEAKLADPGGEIEKLQRQPKAARTQAQNERLIWLDPHVLNATIKISFPPSLAGSRTQNRPVHLCGVSAQSAFRLHGAERRRFTSRGPFACSSRSDRPPPCNGCGKRLRPSLAVPRRAPVVAAGRALPGLHDFLKPWSTSS